MTWKIEEYQIATNSGLLPVLGYTSGGLGLHYDPLHQKSPGAIQVTITHLNTGLSIGHVDGPMALAKKVGNCILRISDWDFKDIKEFLKSHPEFKDEFEKAIAPFNENFRRRQPGRPLDIVQAQEMANVIQTFR